MKRDYGRSSDILEVEEVKRSSNVVEGLGEKWDELKELVSAQYSFHSIM